MRTEALLLRMSVMQEVAALGLLALGILVDEQASAFMEPQRQIMYKDGKKQETGREGGKEGKKKEKRRANKEVGREMEVRKGTESTGGEGRRKQREGMKEKRKEE